MATNKNAIYRIIDKNGKCTFINKTKNEYWKSWKIFKNLTDEEKEKINLATYSKNAILFDRDLDTTDDHKIMTDYKQLTSKLKKENFEKYVSWRSPHGYHILIFFDDLDKLENDVKKEIKKFYILKFNCDLSKVSDKGVISLPNRPHFKDGKVYKVIENIPGVNKLNEYILHQAKYIAEEKRKRIKKQKANVEFKNYFDKDPFFTYVKNNTIPDGTGRDMNMFPNLAAAAVQSGKSPKEIKKIIEPIIKKNFPGKSYSEFEGWLKKAFNNELDYNYIQLNQWYKTHVDNKDIYDFTPIPIEELKEETENTDKINLIWNDNIRTMTSENIDWLVEKWIPKGDICFIAGKAGTFKTTFIMHMGLAIAHGKLVFNKYKVLPGKVLYINEEMNRQTFKNFYNRITNGLDLIETKNFAVSQEEGLRLDLIKKNAQDLTDIERIANTINKEKFDVVIFDSFRRFISYDENDATKTNELFRKLKKLQKFCNGVTIIVVHHLKKFPFNSTFDIKDMLRGSSDIVNSADSIIGVDRKVGHNSFTIMHVKNRSGPEMNKKIILVDSGEKNDTAYLYESTKNIESPKTIVEICAEDIFNIIKSENLKEFSRQEIVEKLKDKYSDSTIFRGFKELESQGIIIAAGKGRNIKWIWDEGE